MVFIYVEPTCTSSFHVKVPHPYKAELAKGNQKILIDVVLTGLSGPIEVNGKSFDGVMSPIDYLEDEEITEILTYIKKEFGDNSSPVGRTT